jgi:hypothetical protein
MVDWKCFTKIPNAGGINFRLWHSMIVSKFVNNYIDNIHTKLTFLSWKEVSLRICFS